jgi:predicted transcriptional regulator
MSISEKYDLAEDQLKAFTRSAVRTKTFLYLKDHNMDSGELEDKLGIRATTILHSLKDMIDTGLVEKSREGYTLTNVGKVQAILIDQLVSAIVVLDEHKDFWQTHDVSGIPEDLLARIGMLGRSEILRGDPAAILKTQEYWFSEVIKSKEISGLSPVIIPAYPVAIAKALENGAKVELILTKPIMEIVLKEYKEQLTAMLAAENFKLYSIDKDVRMAYTVTDFYLSLGLFRLDGGYDVGSDLNCFGESSRDWGKELFEYHRSMSVPIDHT